MSHITRTIYTASLVAAYNAVELGEKDQAMVALKQAMQCANKSKDARYRRAVFRAMSFTRRIA